MSYMALYREWRPKTFHDVIGQDHIVRTVKNQILSNRIPHAYLFCGTRGTGKTSTAKILSKAVNCLNPLEGDPCNECEACREINQGTEMDVVEIDAASNNRVENIRELIEDVKYPPHRMNYKVYIIDEVHMLSTSAFNALLKTLEEPPAYVMFILATTDPQKVPPTILSRCQRFDFKRIKTEDIVSRLRKITDEGKIDIENKTLEVIARISDGAMRDALSILDQGISMSSGSVSYTDITSMLGLTSNEYIFNLVDYMSQKNVETSIKIIDDIILNGKDILQFIKDMTKHFRDLLMVKISKNPEEIIDASEDTINLLKEQARRLRSEEIMRAINIMVQAENDAKYTAQPRVLLEIAIIKFCKREFDASPETVLTRLNLMEEKIKSGAIAIASAGEVPRQVVKTEESKLAAAVAQPKVKEEPAHNDYSGPSDITIDEVRSSWQEVMNLLKSNKKMVVYAYLEPGDIQDVKGNTIIIGFDEKFAFSKSNLEKSENKQIAEEYFTKILNKNIKLQYKIIENESGTDKSVELARQFVGDGIIEVIE
jgi:DNA polymerase III subunit gamma/tau